jgi:hypothetical protein
MHSGAVIRRKARLSSAQYHPRAGFPCPPWLLWLYDTAMTLATQFKSYNGHVPLKYPNSAIEMIGRDASIRFMKKSFPINMAVSLATLCF